MTVYQAFYDASGSETAPNEPLVVTGVLAKQSGWAQLDEAWNRGLTKYGLPYIHLTELVNPKSPHHPLLDDANFFRTFVQPIKQFTLKTFYVRLIPADFTLVGLEYDLKSGYGGAYAITAATALQIIEKWWRARSSRVDELQHYFEHGDRGQATLRPYLAAHEGTAEILTARDEASGRYVIPFQVADICGYGHRKHVKEYLAGSGKLPPKQVGLFQRHLPFGQFMMTADHLRDTCTNYPLAFPKRT
jgi:hypothetical protein